MTGPEERSGEHPFVLEVTLEMCGKLQYRVRVYPYQELTYTSLRDGHDAMVVGGG